MVFLKAGFCHPQIHHPQILSRGRGVSCGAESAGDQSAHVSSLSPVALSHFLRMHLVLCVTRHVQIDCLRGLQSVCVLSISHAEFISYFCR